MATIKGRETRMLQVTPISKALSEVFRGNFLKIPRFQRPYSWDKENLSDFWHDLVERPNDDYFMGSTVVFRDEKEKNLYYIVDDQQRLTTIVICLSVIRDAFAKIGNQDAAEGIQNLLISRDIDNKLRFVLAHDQPNKFFQQRIQEHPCIEKLKPEPGEQQALSDARDFLALSLENYLNTLTGKKKADPADLKEQKLSTLRNRLLALQFISIELIHEDDAYLIFETLNTRGKDLQVADLVKNLFTRIIKVKVKDLDHVKNIWSEMLDNFNNSIPQIDPDTFLLHYWLANESYVSKAALFKEIKLNIKEKNALEYL